MRVCITLRTTDPLPRAEDLLFDFTTRLENSCDSIAGCTIVAEGPVPVGNGMQTWSVRLSADLFGEEIKALGIGSRHDGDEALSAALQDALDKSLLRMQPVARTHFGCACSQRASQTDCPEPDSESHSCAA